MSDVSDAGTTLGDPSPVLFQFDSSLAKTNAQPILDERNKLSMEIQMIQTTLVSEFPSLPAVQMLLCNIMANPAEAASRFHCLSKAFARLSDLYDDFVPLDTKIKLVESILKDPNFVALMFADMSKEVEALQPGDFMVPPSDPSSLTD